MVLSFVNKHRCANTFTNGDAPFGADDVDTVTVVVGLWLGEELYIRMNAVLEAKRCVTTLSEDKSCIPVSWVDSNAIPQTSPAQISGLGISIGSEVGAIDVIPQYDAGGNNVGPYLIAATAKFPGSGGWDCVTGTWVGPGNSVVLDGPNGTGFVMLLNGPGDEFQLGFDRTGLIAVTDTGPGHPIGGGNAVIATRAAVRAIRIFSRVAS